MALALGSWLAPAHGKDPDVPLTNAPKLPPSIAQGCAIHGYTCPAGLTCVLQAMPPGAGSAVTQFTAYICRHPQPADPKATTCPTGLVAQWVTPSARPGQAGAATLFCVPDPRACPPFSPAWVKQQAWPLDPPALGYTCSYARASR
jgi:hypothetical protein